MASVTYTVYDAVTGEILRSGITEAGSISDDVIYNIAPNVNDATHFVDLTGAPTVAPKVASSALISKQTALADGVDTVSVSALPPTAQIRVRNVSTRDDYGPYAITDGTADLTFDTAGTYRIQIESVTELPLTYEVIAT